MGKYEHLTNEELFKAVEDSKKVTGNLEHYDKDLWAEMLFRALMNKKD